MTCLNLSTQALDVNGALYLKGLKEESSGLLEYW